jgi:hypothetical protein
MSMTTNGVDPAAATSSQNQQGQTSLEDSLAEAFMSYMQTFMNQTYQNFQDAADDSNED